MPTLLIWRGHKFRFYAADRFEPPHIHVVKDSKSAKIWLRNFEVASNRGYTESELKQVLAQIREHRDEWMEAWNDFFGI